MPRPGLIVVTAVASVALTSTQAATARVQEPSLDRVLERAADYVSRLHSQLSSIVAEETYVQAQRSTLDSSLRPLLPSRRDLKSDFLLVKAPRESRYVEYRDVFEVDGAAVRDRQERLTALFLTPRETARRQVEAIVNESARHNIGDISRNINTPMLTLSFLLREMQPRFRFRALSVAQPQLSDRTSTGGDPTTFRTTGEMWTIGFREIRRPTLIRTNEHRDFPAVGRVWINPDTGVVLMSELQMDNRKVAATINVSYQFDGLLGFFVPAEMRERYEARGLTIEGRAAYGRFRQFQVSTHEVIGKPPGGEPD